MYSRVFTRSVSSGVESRQIFDDFLRFVKTPKNLRPFIYRKKNANKLLAMDLIDPETKRPIQPREPVHVPGASVYNDIIFNTSSAQELESFMREWRNITPRRKEFWGYFNSTHLQNALLASTFRFDSLRSTLNLLYQLQPFFVKSKQMDAFDVDVWFNSVLMCQLHRNEFKNVKDSSMVASGLKKLSSTVTKKEDTTGLAKELIGALAHQQGATVEKLPGFCKTSEVILQSIDVQQASASQLNVYLAKNRSNYLLSKTILRYGSSSPVEVSKFVENYQLALKQADKTDPYDRYLSFYEKCKNEKESEPQEEEQPKEEDK